MIVKTYITNYIDMVFDYVNSNVENVLAIQYKFFLFYF